MNVLRLRIYQPQAHYRIPFTYQRRHTYPIPPYSTVIGFLCNVLGIDNQSTPEFKKLRGIKISIAGRFESKTTEYIWFRNLAKSAHVARFGYVENRSIGGHVEHIGGQSPILIDVLNDVHLVIHLIHEDRDFLEGICSSLQTPVRRLEILHLGRAEDWIVIDELSNVRPLSESSEFPIKRVSRDFRHFFWIPEKIFMSNLGSAKVSAFDEFEGLLYNVHAFWTIKDFERTLNRHGQRIFEYMRAKLNDGLIMGSMVVYDTKIGLPIFPADFKELGHE